MGKVMLIAKVTRIAEIEGEKDQAVQLLSQVLLAAMSVVSGGCCRKVVGGSTSRSI